jgi:hypothetical protein
MGHRVAQPMVRTCLPLASVPLSGRREAGLPSGGFLLGEACTGAAMHCSMRSDALQRCIAACGVAVAVGSHMRGARSRMHAQRQKSHACAAPEVACIRNVSGAAQAARTLGAFLEPFESPALVSAALASPLAALQGAAAPALLRGTAPDPVSASCAATRAAACAAMCEASSASRLCGASASPRPRAAPAAPLPEPLGCPSYRVLQRAWSTG